MRLYRARLPSPEDILDTGQASRGRDERAKGPRAPREDRDYGPRESAPRPRSAKAGQKHAMTDGVWFRAAIGKRKNAEARWLLPMICRRGGITRQDIGAIRIFDTSSEFEISAAAAEEFAAQIRRPDKDDNIRIEPLIGAKPIEQDTARPPSRAHGDSKPEPYRHKRPQPWTPLSDDPGREPREKYKAGDKPAGGPRSKAAHDDRKPHAGDAAVFDRAGFAKKPFKKSPFKKDKSRADKPAFAGKADNQPRVKKRKKVGRD